MTGHPVLFVLSNFQNHSVPPQEATSASLTADEQVREELDARKQRAKTEFLRGRDQSDDKAASKTKPEPERDQFQVVFDLSSTYQISVDKKNSAKSDYFLPKSQNWPNLLQMFWLKVAEASRISFMAKIFD